MALGDIHEGAAVGTEHPLVGREDQEVGIERLHVDVADADIVRGIDQQCRALGLGRGGDARHVERAAVRPMDRGDRDQGERLGAGAVDRGHHRRRPVAVGRLLHRLDREAAGFGAAHPFQHRRGVVVLQHQHAAAARDGQHLAGGRHAVADRGDQRDVDGLGADQRGCRLARAFILLRLEVRRQFPRLALARDGGAARLLHRDRQRAVGGGVEETDLARDVEQGALAGQHGSLRWHGRRVARPRRSQPDNFSRQPFARLRHAPFPAPTPDLPHRGDGRDALSPGRAGPHRRRLGLCRAPARGAVQAQGQRLHLGAARQDPGAGARPGAGLLRPAGRHRERAGQGRCRRPSVQPARHCRDLRHDPHRRRLDRRRRQGRGAGAFARGEGDGDGTRGDRIVRGRGSTSRNGTIR